MALITYADKVKINENADVPAINKVRDVDMNEIKEVVNQNYNEQVPQMITASLETSTSVTAQSGQIPLNVSVVAGDKLSFSSSTNKITIGSDISKVKISANMRVSTNVNASIGINLNIMKNDDVIIASNRFSLGANAYGGLAIAPKIVNVTQGDTLYLAYWKSSSSQAISIMDETYGSTYLTVEVVE